MKSQKAFNELKTFAELEKCWKWDGKDWFHHKANGNSHMNLNVCNNPPSTT